MPPGYTLILVSPDCLAPVVESNCCMYNPTAYVPALRTWKALTIFLEEAYWIKAPNMWLCLVSVSSPIGYSVPRTPVEGVYCLDTTAKLNLIKSYYILYFILFYILY